jgi:ABC-type multidrug transport system fused ATPase/permease subunit
LVSARLSKALLSQPLTFVQRRSSQQTAFALINGAGAATIQILGQMAVAMTELALLVVLGAGLFLVSPAIAIGAIAFFALIAYILQRAMGGWASRVGHLAADAEVASLDTVQEALAAYREVTVTERRQLYVERIQSLRWRASKVMADTMFIQMFPKYMFEGALVVGGFALAGFLFATQDSVEAVGTLALFLAAGTRVMPSLLRLQGATLGLRSNAGIAAPTFELAHELGHPQDVPGEPQELGAIADRIRKGNPDFVPSILLRNVSVRYDGAKLPALSDFSLEVRPGESVALVGRSGAGKSTLADVILGVLAPDEGTVALGGLPPSLATARWAGGIGYVPQEVMLANGTVRANVALGLPRAAVDDELVWDALSRAHLSDFIEDSGQGLDLQIGERGLRLSGGQRQRLGIARALFTRPKLLVLDEATSALDAETEHTIAQMIRELDGEVTTVIIAHRLSTVREADVLVYLDKGRKLAAGTFDEVSAAVPAFHRQASMMGISRPDL